MVETIARKKKILLVINMNILLWKVKWREIGESIKRV